MNFIYWAHIYIIQVILNILAFKFTNVFINNQTYIGYTLNHPIYLFCWTISSVLGFYFYSKKIWESYQFPYSKKIHFIFCIAMIVSAFFPYSDNLNYQTNAFHVGICGIGLVGFILEWLYFFGKCYPFFKKECYCFLGLLFICFFIMMYFNHITSFCEILFTYFMNLFLYQWLKKRRIP